MDKHALLAPSAADRWMQCPGSVAMERPYISGDNSSDFAEEGTAAHELASWALTENNQCEAYIGRVAENGWKITREMAEDTQIYVDGIRRYAEGNQLFVEQRLSIEQFTKEKDAAGTSDAVIITGDLQELQVHDLKFGRGIQVFAEFNRQLMIYALGALEQFGMIGEFKRVRLVIHQPRLNHLSEWDMALGDLLLFAQEVRDAAEQCFTALEEKTPTDHLNPGDKQCQWCKAKATCPALAEYVHKQVGADFLDLTTRNNVDDLVPVGDAQLLADKMVAIDIIETWCRAVRAEVERCLMEGRHVPGFKIVQGKQGNRKWTDSEVVEDVLKKMRLKQEEMYDFSLISPTTAEKRLKGNPRQWKKLQDYITRTEGKPSVAPMSDPRPPMAITPVENDFQDHTGGEFA